MLVMHCASRSNTTCRTDSEGSERHNTTCVSCRTDSEGSERQELNKVIIAHPAGLLMKVNGTSRSNVPSKAVSMCTYHNVSRGVARRSPRTTSKSTATKKRCVKRAHNSMLAQIARAPCPATCPPLATPLRLASLLTSLLLAPPVPLASLQPNNHCTAHHHTLTLCANSTTYDDLNQPTARTMHQSPPAPPAMLDGTGLLQILLAGTLVYQPGSQL